MTRDGQLEYSRICSHSFTLSHEYNTGGFVKITEILKKMENFFGSNSYKTGAS